MRKIHHGKSKKTNIIRGDRAYKSWRRHIGRNKKIHMIDSRKKIDPLDSLY